MDDPKKLQQLMEKEMLGEGIHSQVQGALNDIRERNKAIRKLERVSTFSYVRA